MSDRESGPPSEPAVPPDPAAICQVEGSADDAAAAAPAAVQDGAADQPDRVAALAQGDDDPASSRTGTAEAEQGTGPRQGKEAERAESVEAATPAVTEADESVGPVLARGDEPTPPLEAATPETTEADQRTESVRADEGEPAAVPASGSADGDPSSPPAPAEVAEPPTPVVAAAPEVPVAQEPASKPSRRRRRRRAPLTARVAIVHDYLNQMGGAERVLEVLHDIYPDAPIYTSIYDPMLVSKSFARMDVRTSFLQRLPFVARHHQAFLALYPAAFEQLDLSGYDLVLSMSSAWSKGVITPPETCHICYCLSPMRFAWQAPAYAAQERIPGWAKWFLPHVLSWLRTWDATTAQRVDWFAAISRTVAQRITKYYRRTATIIYPPVDTRRYQPADTHDDYFLVVSRLIPYKRIDLAVRACTELGLPLKVVGAGRNLTRLQALAGPTVEFLGRLPDDSIRELMARCRALLFPGEEDFGLTPIEVQASGRPVIALARGGALETVVHGRTGLLFPEPTVASLATALQSFQDSHFDSRVIRRHAARFDTARFKERLTTFVASRFAVHRAGLGPTARTRRRRPHPRRARG